MRAGSCIGWENQIQPAFGVHSVRHPARQFICLWFVPMKFPRADMASKASRSPGEGPNRTYARLGPARGSKRARLPASEVKVFPRSESKVVRDGLVARCKRMSVNDPIAADRLRNVDFGRV